MGGGWQAGISDREREVLGGVARHRTNAQIARELRISVRTVESHVASLLRKFGVGDRRALADLVRPSVDERLPKPAPVVGVPANRDSFVGREHVVEQVVAGLSKARLVTLLGPGGIGKSRLAVAVVGLVGHRFSDGGAFVDLVGTAREYVAQTMAAAFDVGELPLRSLADAVAWRIGDNTTLLAVDNCDHLIEEASELVSRLLASCPRLTVLVTSRERLGVVGERAIQVPPLPVESEAVRLFTDRACGVDPDFDADPCVVAEICRRLDGMPLTIELAAARVGSFGIDSLREALDDSLRTLAGGRGSDPRHRSLRNVVGWSYDLLTGEERSLFRRLAVFVGSFDVEAAVAVSRGIPRAVVLDLIGRLVDRSLLGYFPAANRWRMLATIRAFAADRLSASGEEATVRRWHLEWAAAAASAIDGRRGLTWRDDFDRVVGDLRAASAATAPEPDEGAHRLARSIARLAFARGAFAESRRHHEAAAARADDPMMASHDLMAAAEAALALADGPGAYRLLLDAAWVARDGDHPAVRVAALARAVIVANRFPAQPYAVPDGHAAELLRSATAAADPDGATIVDTSEPGLAALLAAARAWGGAGGRAVEPDLPLSEAAVEAADRAGDLVLRMCALDALGAALAMRGRLRDAARITAERLQIAATLPRDQPAAVVEIVDAFHSAAAAALRTGQLPDALAIARRARTDDPVGDHPVFAAYKEALPLALAGRLDEAVYRAETMWEEVQRGAAPPPSWLAPVPLAAALVYGLRGDDAADLWWSRAAEVAKVDSPDDSLHLAALAAFVRARVAIHTGEFRDAPQMVLRCFADVPAPRFRAYAQAAGAELAAVAGLPDAPDRVMWARASAAENAWTAASLQRTMGRLHMDRDVLVGAVEQWAAIDARFERACTLLLIPGRGAEGRAEFAEIGCPPPVSR